MKRIDQRGFTLLELLLYSVIAVVVIMFSLSLIRTTSRNYTRDRRKSRMQTEGRNAILMMTREIVNTGFNTYLLDNGDGTFTEVQVDNTTTGDADVLGEANPDGLSSFIFTPGDPDDQLEIFKASLDNAGQYVSTERILYNLGGNTLFRTIDYWGGADWNNTPETMELANNVEALQFQFSTDNTTWIDNFSGPETKDQIKAIRIFVLIRTNKETDMSIQKTYNPGDITIAPAGDKYLRRLYIETVEVVNNG